MWIISSLIQKSAIVTTFQLLWSSFFEHLVSQLAGQKVLQMGSEQAQIIKGMRNTAFSIVMLILGQRYTFLDLAGFHLNQPLHLPIQWVHNQLLKQPKPSSLLSNNQMKAKIWQKLFPVRDLRSFHQKKQHSHQLIKSSYSALECVYPSCCSFYCYSENLCAGQVILSIFIFCFY